MTKGVHPRRLPMTNCDQSQKDAHILKSSNQTHELHESPEQRKFPDSNNDVDLPFTTSDACTPTSLEELLDLEMGSAVALTPLSNQKFSLLQEEEKLEGSIDFVSLEVLAMQSPHGEAKEWNNKKDKQNGSSSSHRPENSPHRKFGMLSNAQRTTPLSTVSPTESESFFSTSSSQFLTDDDFGLLSPMSLPDTPSRSRSKLALPWNLELSAPPIEVAITNEESFCHLRQCNSDQGSNRRASSSILKPRAATPNPRNHRDCGSGETTLRLTRSSLPTLPEIRIKARHGGIYSLLLKNRSLIQEPILLKDAQNPEEVTALPSESKDSPSQPFGKQRHGGIYKMLRNDYGLHQAT
ncbi:uncharacterized protein PHALS_09080 [Plasmopara halstedii]|uniref:Uncharacterized protein n=1 Tax=Plasmopara halstedii TaxID=4781 RepID=A0A0P1AEE0_PLAHL|nr:uncharacterized protein PHALS_09080 [Plasmopara halstedii]CEG39015.1 hypothetical protein PHALS_09080 [Plasmopara halstedii]|eukprot:XP_024575384.1 hypothetical protein PHALS_09080 [Plasmopara halstedii]